MIVPESILNKWNDLKDQGDITAISKQSGLNRFKVATAFDGETTEEVFEAINNFYIERANKVKEAEEKLR